MDIFNESFESDPDLLVLPVHPVNNKTDNPEINIEINLLFIVCNLIIIANLSIFRVTLCILRELSGSIRFFYHKGLNGFHQGAQRVNNKGPGVVM